jgi:hypothetical protein
MLDPPAGAERSSAFSLTLRYTAFAMSASRRYFAPGRLQFITSSVYRRLKLLDCYRLRPRFVEVLREYRQEAGFLLVGWVLNLMRNNRVKRGMLPSPEEWA